MYVDKIEETKLMLTPSEFFYRMSQRMKRLEQRLAKARRTEDEIILELYRRINYI